MSVTQAVTKELPYLRRFARAVLGGQRAGDQSVAAAIKMAVDSKQLPPRGSLKIPLFQALAADLRLLSSEAGEIGATSDHPERFLAGVALLPRMHFLLVAVEGFAEADAALILNLTDEQLASVAEQARVALAEQLSTDVMVIEDEPLIALELEDLVTELGHNLVGVARTRDEAVEIAASGNPKLCLADIQLADNSSGIDAVNDILKTVEIPIIFITAFPERFLTGERPEPAFLISKPFDRDSVQAQISQALFFDQKARRSE